MKINSIVRRIIRKAFRNSGFQRRIAPDFVDIMLAHEIDVVLDIGANDGDYGREIRDRGYKGLIISFEPNPIVYKRLQTAIAKDPKWHAYSLAFGEEDGEAMLSVAQNDTMSSFKRLTEFGQNTSAKQMGTVNVKIARLDTFLNKHPEFLKNTYLKIDTQGFEMEVLRGAGELLSKITAIQAEIALVHTYADEFDWLDIIYWIRKRKFEVVTAICNSTLGPRVREFDFVFVRR